MVKQIPIQFKIITKSEERQRVDVCLYSQKQKERNWKCLKIIRKKCLLSCFADAPGSLRKRCGHHSTPSHLYNTANSVNQKWPPMQNICGPLLEITIRKTVGSENHQWPPTPCNLITDILWYNWKASKKSRSILSQPRFVLTSLLFLQGGGTKIVIKRAEKGSKGVSGFKFDN